jgi:L-histidine Nalpha-methyltransferase
MSALQQQLSLEIADDVYQGLSRRRKTLPPKLFYDAVGSAIFEEITALPEYYLTRTELQILEARAQEICVAAGHNITVVELGAGTASKTRTIIQALARRQLRVSYFPVDLSRTALQKAKRELESLVENLRVEPVVADMSADLNFLRGLPGRKLVLYIGSSIGNFELPEAVAFLRRLRTSLNPDDALLLGTDLVKHPDILLPAYDDRQGVTARFNKNLLERINRELQGHFDLDLFTHVARWNPECSRIEMYLESNCEQVVPIDLLPLCLHFGKGERIHTENSYKYTLPLVEAMLQSAGFTLEKTWTDARQWFAVHLARVM